MRAKLSIVIPTLNAAGTLPLCLNALGDGLKAGVIREVVFSDGGSQDQTLEIAEMAGAVVVTGPASRGGQLRRGVQAAKGEWLLVLHADSILPSGWPAVVAAQMQDGRPAAFRLGFDAKGIAPWLVARWANLRSRLFHLPYGDQALLISRRDYDAVGGYRDFCLRSSPRVRKNISGTDGYAVVRATYRFCRGIFWGWTRRVWPVAIDLIVEACA